MKVAICTPMRDEPDPRYLISMKALQDFVRANPLSGLKVRYFHRHGPLLANREALTERALEWGADYLLWVDDDMIFPPHSLHRLLSHRVPIVGCNYANRHRLMMSTAIQYNETGDIVPLYTTAERANEVTLEAVAGFGLGLCLFAAEVFLALSRPWFTTWYDEREKVQTGEDYTLCRMAKQAGFQPLLDHNLSWMVGHITRDGRVLMNRDSLAVAA